MKIHEIWVGIIVVGMFITGSIIFMGGWSTYYDKDIATDGLNNSITEMNYVQDNATALGTKLMYNLTTSTLIPDAFEIPYNLLVVALGSIQLIGRSFATVGVIGNDITGVAISSGIAIPSWVLVSIMTILVISIIAIIIYAILKWKGED